MNYDDDRYITKNRVVASGLTLKATTWAFTTFEMGNWHPLTWISHEIDISLFGLFPPGHHFGSVALHALSASMLFLALRSLTGVQGVSAFVAAVFALHPLRVESVAWAAERKDVLAGLSWSVSLLLYAYWMRRKTRSRGLALLAVFVLGLMAKPSVVTLPIVLLILDYWPLARFRHNSVTSLLLEKTPLVVLGLASSVVTLFAQRNSDALWLQQSVGISDRVGNALLSYVAYLGKLLWPMRLAHYYPHPMEGIGRVQIALSFSLLAAIFAMVWLRRRRHPWLFAGWAWYFSTLLPMIGLVQVGGQAMADRYTYLTLTGVVLAVAWELHRLGLIFPPTRAPIAAAALVFLAALLPLTWRQVGYWQNSITLSKHTLSVTRDNWFAENNLGTALGAQGHFEDAIPHFREVLRINPSNTRAMNNMGVAFFNLGRYEEALQWFSRAAKLDPSNREVRANLDSLRLIYRGLRRTP